MKTLEIAEQIKKLHNPICVFYIISHIFHSVNDNERLKTIMNSHRGDCGKT